MGDYASWEFEEGEEIAPGRVVLKPLGGGNRYEVFLVWDEALYALARREGAAPRPGRRREGAARPARARSRRSARSPTRP